MDKADVETRAAGGDCSAFTALMSSTKAELYRFVLRYVGDEDESFDLVQETYAAAWLSIDRYDPNRPFDVWLRAIALNKCRDWGRRRAVRRVVRGAMGLDAPEATAIGADEPDPADRVDAKRRLDRLHAALIDMPDSLKAPLLLSTLEGRAHAESAEMLGITAKAVETRVARARRWLAERVDNGPKKS